MAVQISIAVKFKLRLSKGESGKQNNFYKGALNAHHT